jgi:hypothetical protein
MNTDRIPAHAACAAFNFVLHKESDAVLFDFVEIFDHAHSVLRAIAKIKLSQARTGITAAVETIFFARLPLCTQLDAADITVMQFLRIGNDTPGASVLAPLMPLTNAAIHAAGGDHVSWYVSGLFHSFFPKTFKVQNRVQSLPPAGLFQKDCICFLQSGSACISFYN